jgi:hypothetical protein
VGILKEGDGGELGPSWTGVAPVASERLQAAPRAPGDGSVMVLMDETAILHGDEAAASEVAGSHDRCCMVQQGKGQSEMGAQ